MSLSSQCYRAIVSAMCGKTNGKEVADALIHQAQIDVADLAADGDQAALATWITKNKCTLDSVGLALVGSAAGIDGSNTVVVTVSVGGNTIVTKTFGATAPTNDALNDLGTLSSTYKELPAGSVVKLAITQGATANLPPCKLVLTYTPRS